MKKNNKKVLKTALAILLCLAGAVLIWLSVKYSMQHETPIAMQAATRVLLPS